MAFDYKKEYREFYLPPRRPGIIDVPQMNFIAVRGHGDPNVEGGAYQHAVSLLYGVAYTIRMSPRAGHAMDGYFAYVVPPLEGFWWQEGVNGIDPSRKEDFNWISCIRLPEFVGRDDLVWALAEATRKKNMDFSQVEFITLREGLCVQCMHIGAYDDEPVTVEAMHAYAAEQGYELDFSAERLHHEIYLSDARRCDPAKLKTVVRHPIRGVSRG